MSIPETLSPEAQEAIDNLFGTSNGTQSHPRQDAPQRLQRAAVAAAQQVQQQHDSSLDSARLSKGLELALGNAVTLHLDGTASVRNGERCHVVADASCTCEDFTHRKLTCKHVLAVAIYRRTLALLLDAPEQAAPPASSAWDVKEAPVSVCLKLRFGRGEITYTMRGVTDAEVEERLQTRLEMIHELEDAYESRQAARAEAAQVARAKTEQATPAETPDRAENPAEAEQMQQMIQQAVQQAIGQAGGHTNGNGSQPPEAGERYNDKGEKWCFLHEEWMPERSNEHGTWNSHLMEDEEGEYYCKGKGRPRRRNR